MKNKISLLLMMVIGLAVAFCNPAFAASDSTMTGSVKYNDTKSTLTAQQVSAIQITETGNDIFKDGFFTVTIPSEVALYNIGTSTGNGAITQSTTVLGSSTSPKKLYVLHSNDQNKIFFRHGASQFAIMNVYASGATSTPLVYGTAATPLNAGSNYANLADVSGWSKINYKNSGTSTVSVGSLYYDSTTKETIISLGAIPASKTSADKLLVGEGMKLKPTTTNTTGDVKVALADGKADGTAGLGITAKEHKVMVLVNQPANLSGTTAPTTVPSINAGSVAAQPMGVAKLTFVGDGPTSGTASTLIFSLNNGAEFHNNASTPLTAKATDGFTGVTLTDDDFTVNSSGDAVLSLTAAESQDVADGDTFTWIADSALINADGVTASAPITLTVTGTGDFAAMNQSVLVANAQIAGVDVIFKDDTTAGVPTLFAGRKNQELGSTEYVLVGEKAPTSLLKGGSITMALNLGAKFQTSATIPIVDKGYTTSPYTNAKLEVTDIASPAASATKSISVVESSDGSRGAFTLAKGATDWLDLSSATKGDLTLTFGGTAGASGAVTIASVIDPTTTTALTTPVVVPGATLNLPDIQIVENKAGALAASYFGIKFPSSFTLDTTATPTVTATDGAGTASTTAVSYDSWDGSDKVAWFKVNSKSNSTAGAYTIVISGMQGSFASTAATSDTKFTIAGSAADDFKSNAFGGNYGAMPKTESVAFCQIVSATLPFFDTPIVSGDNITQTFIPAGNDIGKVGDVYVFTSGSTPQYFDGAAWSSTATPYGSSVTLNTMTVYYNVTGLADGTKVYLGYGLGLTNTLINMNDSATFVLSYTVSTQPVSQETGKDVGETDVTFDVADDIELYLNITNDDSLDPATDIAYEWLVFGAIVNGVDAGLFFFTDAGDVVAFDATLDLTTVTYTFDHTSDSFKVTDLNMGTLGLTAGDVFWYGYVYGTTGFALADATTWSLENYVMITAQ